MSMFDELVEQYHPQTNDELTSAQREVMQKVALAGLNRGGFFEHAAFYGDTCLRIFHGLRRYSEDMDFSLTEKNDKIHIENYFDAIVDEFKMLYSARPLRWQDACPRLSCLATPYQGTRLV